MTTETETLAMELNLNLDSIAKQLLEKDRFLEVCTKFVQEDHPIEALGFCMYLRKNGFPLVAKTICHFFMKTNPGALSQVIAA